MKFPDRPTRGRPLLAWCANLWNYLRANRIVSVTGGKLKEAGSGGKILEIDPPDIRDKRRIKPPLWTELTSESGTGSLFAQSGKVIKRANSSGDELGVLAITSLPTKASPQTVLAGDKIWVKLDIDEHGQATAATWGKNDGTTQAWPSNTPVVLVGGDIADGSGTAGVTYVKVAEISADPTFTDRLIITRHLTGHIDHYQPTLSENAIVTAATGQARALQKWSTAKGAWLFRMLAEKSGGGAVSWVEDGTFARCYSKGDTFIVKLWETSITLITPGPTLEIDAGTSPTQTFWVWDGIWFKTEPAGFPTGVTTHHFSYVLPTTGGP